MNSLDSLCKSNSIFDKVNECDDDGRGVDVLDSRDYFQSKNWKRRHTRERDNVHREKQRRALRWIVVGRNGGMTTRSRMAK